MARSGAADNIIEGDAPAGSPPNAYPLTTGVFDGTNMQYLGGDASGVWVANKAVTLRASAADAVAHTVNGAAVTNLGHFKQLMVFLNVTAAAAAAGDTLDVYIDTSPDGGTTWVNAIHFTTVLGNGGAKSFWAVLDPAGAAAATVTATSVDAASGVVRPSMFTDQIRYRYVIVDGGAHGQSFTFAVQAFAKA